MFKDQQIDLFPVHNFNVLYGIKRQIRQALAGTHLSRDQVADRMNEFADRETLPIRKVKKETLDGWCKESDLSRAPNLLELEVFCHVMETVGPIRVMLRALGGDAIGPEEMKVLAWGQAELKKRRAVKEARRALEAIN